MTNIRRKIGYLNVRNENVQTLKTLIIPNKKAPEGANFKNGADGRSLLELFMTKDVILLNEQINRWWELLELSKSLI